MLILSISKWFWMYWMIDKEGYIDQTCTCTCKNGLYTI